MVAKSRVEAQTAAEAISVDYEVLPSVVDPVEATKPGAPAVWPQAPDNIVAANYGDAGRRWKKGFPRPRTPSRSNSPVSGWCPPRWSRARPLPRSRRERGRLLLYTESETPVSPRHLLAGAILKRPPDSVRVLVGDIGGGFGQKTSLYPEDGIVAYAATKLNKKIRWRGDRTDEFVGGTHGRDLTSTGEFALDAKAACRPIGCARSAAP